jgi:hypothetical protein
VAPVAGWLEQVPVERVLIERREMHDARGRTIVRAQGHQGRREHESGEHDLHGVPRARTTRA